MIREEKNLKDTNLPLPNLPLDRGRSEEGVMSYTKTNKLITALYMVTDILDEGEPLRNKLRTLGTGIISDMNSSFLNVCNKVSEIMSFLDIAVAVNIISEMNYSILKKEFLELDQSIKEFTGSAGTVNKRINLTEFFRNSPLEEYPLGGGGINLSTPAFSHPSRGELISKGHTRIGIQKGSTLMRALSGVGMSNSREARPNALGLASHAQRRNDIINIIKTIGGNVTIKDIKDKIQNSSIGAGTLVSYSEKTLQRELVSMVKDNVLNKIGEKRWSKYGLGSRV